MAGVTNHLFINVAGGATLALGREERLDKGANALKLKLGKDTGGIDVLEQGPAGSLVLERSKIGKEGAEIVLRSDRARTAKFTVTAGLNAAVEISHRLSIDALGGSAEWTTYAKVTNNSKTTLKDTELTITAGDTQNQRGPVRRFAARAALESVADSAVSQPSAAVYQIHHPHKLELGKGESVTINLYNKDFALKDVRRKLEFVGQSWDHFDQNPREVEAGPCRTQFYLENDQANGLGAVLPQGAVRIVSKETGATLSDTNIEDTSIGRQIKLDGGNAFDVETRRKQTSFEAVGQPVSQGRGQAKLQRYAVGHEIRFDNKSKRDEVVQFAEQLPQSNDGEKPTSVKKVTVNGVELPKDKWSVSEQDGQLRVPDLALKAGGELKVGYELETTGYTI